VCTAALLHACAEADVSEAELDLEAQSSALLEPDAGPDSADTGAADGPIDPGAPGGGAIAGDDGGPGGSLGAGSARPSAFAHWTFDDCGPSLTLQDSSPTGAHAQRSPQVACAAGPAAGSALAFDDRRGTLSAAPHPAFALDQRLTVSAWLYPQRTSEGALIRKELNRARAFALDLQQGKLVFRLNLRSGRKLTQVVIKLPIQAQRWTHVAAQYDGSFVRLFENGVVVAQTPAVGAIADVAGAILVGNDSQRDRVFNGRIDEVWLSSAAVTPDDLVAQACARGTPTLSVSPTRSGPREAGGSFVYQLAVSNRDVGACQPREVFSNGFIRQLGVTANSFPRSIALAPGQSGQLAVHVSHSTEATPGSFEFPINVIFLGREPPPDGPFDTLESSVEYTVNQPVGCFVRASRELLMRDLSVVEDPLRTRFEGPDDDPRTGAWTFGRLMQQLAPSDAEAPDLVEHLFESWLEDQTINGFSVPAKPRMQTLVLDSWPRTEDGKLDLRRSPLRLLAIVNRIDSRNLAHGHAGEGRFVFGVLGPDGNAEEFTVIFEYRLPATTTADVQDWADRWHALGALPFPSEAYNAALQALSDRFTRRGAEPGRPNGSALAQFRTNEVALTNAFVWELREFELSAETHKLEPASVKLTPDNRFIADSPLVAAFINQNESAVLSEKHDVPPTFEGQAFLGGSSFNDLNTPWSAPGIVDTEARHKFGLNTCNGCHSLVEANTGFLHISRRSAGQVAALSPFMQGTILPDPITGAPRTLNDLQRRADDLTAIVCAGSAAPTSTVSRSATADSRRAFLARGIERTH
ncbi:MAG TPA: LamG domain-containing protein, partial [Polyangiales bacterium]